MAGLATMLTAVYLDVVLHRFANRGKTRFKFPQVSFVILGKKTTGFNVNFMIAAGGLGIVVYIIFLLHNKRCLLMKQKYVQENSVFYGKP